MTVQALPRGLTVGSTTLGADGNIAEIPLPGGYKLDSTTGKYHFQDNTNTNWFKEVFKTGIRQNHNVNLSGGGAHNTYNVSLDYYNQKRYTGRRRSQLRTLHGACQQHDGHQIHQVPYQPGLLSLRSRQHGFVKRFRIRSRSVWRRNQHSARNLTDAAHHQGIRFFNMGARQFGGNCQQLQL